MNEVHTHCADSEVVVQWTLIDKSPFIHIDRVLVQGNSGPFPLSLTPEMLTSFRQLVEETHQ